MAKLSQPMPRYAFRLYRVSTKAYAVVFATRIEYTGCAQSGIAGLMATENP